ncbi:MAG TPA: hypothetical protein VE088_06840 [Gaiellaceae bacterium]|nr:hypothetical protein [Gaiellaceae bacterium]
MRRRVFARRPAPRDSAGPDGEAAEPGHASVVTLGATREPRRWNLWDLERAAREQRGGDALRDEEQSYLLLYLREFADAEGLLPPDFDALVRESFGEAVGTM